jgi:hypothetical protein
MIGIADYSTVSVNATSGSCIDTVCWGSVIRREMVFAQMSLSGPAGISFVFHALRTINL